MELLFFYSKNFENKPAQSLQISNEWLVHYDETTGVLAIQKNEMHLAGFFGDQIISAHALIGANASGKTTMLNTISRVVLHENQVEQIGSFTFLAVYRHGSRNYCYNFGDVFPLKNHQSFVMAKESQWLADTKAFRTVFFSQHIDPLYSSNLFLRLSADKFLHRRDISTAYLYTSSLRYASSNVETAMRDFRKDDFRKFVKLFRHVELKTTRKIPQYINVRIFRRPESDLAKTYNNWGNAREFLNALFSRPKNNAFDYIRYELVNQAFHQVLGQYNRRRKVAELDSFLNRLTRITIKLKDIAFSYPMLLKSLEAICPKQQRFIFKAVLKFLVFLEELSRSSITADGFWLDIQTNGSKQWLEKMDKAGLLDGDLDFIELGFSYRRLEYSMFSSGELALWSLFARLYELRNYYDSVNLILLDEAELTLHPEWQRKFVYTLLDFLNHNFSKKQKFQIVLTSHSPIILSDMPRWAVSRYTGKTVMENDDVTIVHKAFGANIHELYSDSFVLGDSFVGEFASHKIQELAKEIFEKKTFTKKEVEKYDKQIRMIDEDFIRTKLLEKIAVSAEPEGLDYLITRSKKDLQELERILLNKKKRK